MANRTISKQSVNRNFFQDQLSSKDRLFSFGLIDCDIKKNPVTQYRSARKNNEAYRVFFKRSKTVVA